MPYTLYPCKWCGVELYGSASATCINCGAKSDADGDLNDSGDAVYAEWLERPGRADLRAKPLEWDTDPKDGAVYCEDEALECVWVIETTYRLVRQESSVACRPDETVGTYATLDEAKAAAAGGGS
jgi:hypothetical protein